MSRPLKKGTKVRGQHVSEIKLRQTQWQRHQTLDRRVNKFTTSGNVQKTMRQLLELGPAEKLLKRLH
jgi:hypothetical protein